MLLTLLDTHVERLIRTNQDIERLSRRLSSDPRLFYDNPHSERRLSKILSRSRRGIIKDLFQKPLIDAKVDVATSYNKNISITEVGSNGTINKKITNRTEVTLAMGQG